MTVSEGLLASFRGSELLLIAEISSNHNQDIARACELINAACRAGANAVKFQLFELESLFAQEALDASPEHLARKAWELPREFVPTLSNEARSLGMLFGCTPFDLEAVAFLEPYVDFYKVASYELLWLDLIAACGATGKPVILSTGMATEYEVSRAVVCLQDSGCTDMALLHCVSSYPAPRDDINLGAIGTLRDRFNTPTGWSDHSHDPSVVLRAINRWGASIVELHFDLDGKGYESGNGHCWLPSELSHLNHTIKNEFQLDGDGIKRPSASELPDAMWRADPSDGLRPLVKLRASLRK